MSNLTIRTRLLMGVLVPVLITAATIAWMTASQIQTHGKAELERLQVELLDARKQGLRDLLDTARSVVLEAKDNSGLVGRAAQEAARQRLRSISFG
ncbi:MAG: methyl-accepting chemotaxis protein, partial [Marinobacter sp.]